MFHKFVFLPHEAAQSGHSTRFSTALNASAATLSVDVDSDAVVIQLYAE